MERQKAKRRWILGIIGAVVLIAGLLRWGVFQPYVILQPSMEPTLLSGDRIVVNRLAYRSWAPTRGEIVVFAFPKDLKRTFVKRVIAVEGETVELRDNVVLVNGNAIDEPYVKKWRLSTLWSGSRTGRESVCFRR